MFEKLFRWMLSEKYVKARTEEALRRVHYQPLKAWKPEDIFKIK